MPDHLFLRRSLLRTIAVASLVLTSGTWAAETKPLRVGMIGLDTSHVPAFVKLFNSPTAAGDLAGLRIVAGYPGGTDMPSSKNRVEKFTDDVRKMGVEIVDSIPALLEKVDVVLLESVDGRVHLEQAIPVIKAGKPLFIDKPAAGSLADVIVIFELAKKHNVPCFSTSSLRYVPGIQGVKKNPDLGTVAGVLTWGSCTFQEGILEMAYYGIHGIEPLFALLGTGCVTVSRVATKDADIVTGVWQDGRTGTYRGIRTNSAGWGAVVFGSKAIVPITRGGGYEELCHEIGRFFKTRKSPVRPDETIEVFAFMEAADESKRQGGAPVALATVLAKAKNDAAAKMPR